MGQHLLKKNINKTIFAIVFIILLVLISLYLKVFLTKGFYYEGVFLKERVEGTSRHYYGKHDMGDMHISVEGNINKTKYAEITYELPNDIYRFYRIEFMDKNNWDKGFIHIKNNKGQVIFKGSYIKSIGRLRSDTYTTKRVNSDMKYYLLYDISKLHIVETAYGYNVTTRGSMKYLVLVLILSIYLLIDLIYPRFFFQLEHMWSCSYAEPSELYLSIQKAYRFIVPILIIFFIYLSIS